MYGFWKNKRIVLYDTLLSEEMNKKLKEILGEADDDGKPKEEEAKNGKESGDSKAALTGGEQPKTERKRLGMNDDEVVAVLGHELGHWKMWHTVYNLIIMEVSVHISIVKWE